MIYWPERKKVQLLRAKTAELDALIARDQISLPFSERVPRYTLSQTIGHQIQTTTQPVGSAAARFCGSLRWTGDPEELRRCLNDPDESSWSSRDV